MATPTAAILVLALCAIPAAAQHTPLTLKDAKGDTHAVWPLPRAVHVLVFTGTGCPISNSYAPTYAELHAKYAESGVRFFAVNSVDGDAAKVAAHARDYVFPFPVLMDTERRLAEAVKARVTPEAFLFDAKGALRYAGRIDDRWSSRTTKRPEATTHDLAAAIDAVLAQGVVATRRTRAFGCAIPGRAKRPNRDAKVTYHRDVAPILQRRCERCHREGQVAPFELLTYEDAESWGDEIVEFTKSGLMPPWKETGPRGRFLGDPRLTEEEKQTLAAWVAAGMPEGDPKAAPERIEWNDGWQLGKPDIVLQMPEAYTVAAKGPDEFRTFAIPIGNDRELEVRAVEFQPDNRRVVHHMVAFLDSTGRGRRAQQRDPKPGFRSTGTGDFGFRVGILAVWAPGNQVREWGDGVAMRVRPRTDLLLEMHYYRTGKVEKDRSRIGIYLAKKPAEKYVHISAIQSTRFVIPAGAKDSVVRVRRRLRSAREIYTFFPHMHYIGKKIRLRAKRPGDEKAIELLNIQDWDFNWQLNYDLKKPVLLPAGTTLLLEAEYDNSAANPANLFDPPRTVRYGAKTSDEMCLVVLFQSYPDNPKLRSRRRR